MTAHVRIDPQTGELFFFGYEADGLASTKVSYCIADKLGYCSANSGSTPRTAR